MGASTELHRQSRTRRNGRLFERTLNELQIAPTVFRGDEPSGRCVSLVSPTANARCAPTSAQRSKCAIPNFTPEIFDGYEYFYIEGYLVQDHD